MVQVKALPPYDGSYGLVSADNYTNDDLLNRYSVTKPTLFKRRDALVDNGWIKPEKVGPRLYYSPEDVHLIDQVSWWVSKGYTVPEVVAHLKQQERAYKSEEERYQAGWEAAENAFTNADVVGAVDVEARNATTELVVRGLQTSAKDLQVLGEEVIAKFAKAVGAEVRRALPKDNLSAYDFLTKAADKNYLLTSKVLADGIGFKTSTINSWADETDKFGFRITRITRGNYRVRPLTDEEIIAAAVQQVDLDAMRAEMRASGNTGKQGAA